MSDNNDPNAINTLEDYKQFFLTHPPTTEYSKTVSTASTGALTDEQVNRIESLLDIAHRTRNFEIDLYWKRASYYWVFVSVIFVGYYTALEKSALLSVVFSDLGCIFTLGWFLANKGSKYWQENWEEHVNILEILAGIPIHSVTKASKKRCLLSLKSCPYSVSKINQLLNLACCFFWVLVLFYSLFRVWQTVPPLLVKQIITTVIGILFSVIPSIFLLRAKSSVSKVESEQEHTDALNFKIGTLAKQNLVARPNDDKKK